MLSLSLHTLPARMRVVTRRVIKSTGRTSSRTFLRRVSLVPADTCACENACGCFPGSETCHLL
ncbi:MC064R [Molluscum contagiosum virus subtype 1]|uniref:MC064R n=3 Tax=Molluscum contagiosum virus TaxID=10279 RepID=A0A7G5AX65_MCV1|nr:MC064R [Molluscum contagiosum virus subtype 1]AZT86354.1 MC064R [Molluscum contagiosum virus]AAC55192.1 MC064R [Molluscum contagiosum virus subtype 1]AQY16813.1 MC064 [Molluscum contagiosum virus subtype 1]AQY16992.1 MC064 [Molluscum contagiosum virus subtype 1]AQY17171.1 MC064 [Molluscum contagiosum virus subtype 1]